MGLSEDLCDIAGVIAVALLLLVKIGPRIGSNQVAKLSLVLTACAVSVAEGIVAEERADDQRQRRLDLVTRVVAEASYEQANRKRSKLLRGGLAQRQQYFQR
jgi:hypothetical protein